MAGTGKKWLIGCGVGCGVFILLNILFFVGSGILLTRPMNRAVNTQEALTEAFGHPSDFVPGPDSLRPERIEVFLTVRSALKEHCAEIEKLAGGFEAMAAIDEKDDPGIGEILKGLGQVMGSVKGMVTEMSAVLEDRNEALLAEGMGLGEYTWIYVLCYYTWLGHTPNTGIEDAGGHLSSREGDLMEELMSAHARTLSDAGLDRRADVWLNELAKREWEETGVPFTGSELPRSIVEAFEPFRTRLEDAYCAPMADMDLNQIKKKGMSFHAN